MPDISGALDHIRALTALEAALESRLRRSYDDWRRELQDIAQRGGAASIRETLPLSLAAVQATASRDLAAAGDQVLRAVVAAAIDDAARMADVGVPLPIGPAIAASEPDRLRLLQSETERALAWLTGAGGQILAEATRLELTGAEPALVAARLFAPDLGDGRVSLWRSGLGGLGLATSDFVFGLDGVGRGAIYAAAEERSGIVYQKQAIAAIDQRTTRCCLRVHGQIQPLDRPFELTGTPRYADRMMQPPFHWRCRTVFALYHPAMEAVGVTTESLRAAARREASRR
jgi:hypothetical protein